MTGLGASLLKLYLPLVIWVGLGVILGHKLSPKVPFYLGKFLFWIGVPISITTFMRQADLSGSIWIAPLVAWIAVLMGAGLAGLWIWLRARGGFSRKKADEKGARSGLTALAILRDRPDQPASTSPPLAAPAPSNTSTWSQPTQGSFLNAAMYGNTGYLGYPVTLALVGPQYFGWAVFYDTLGSTLAAYGLGVALSAYFGRSATRPSSQQQHPTRLMVQAVVKNPAMWSFWFGLWFRQVALSKPVEIGLQGIAWTVIAASLLLLGMRLSQITSWRNTRRAAVSLGIKMLVVPLIVGIVISLLGISGPQRLVMILQMGMPPAFATLIIAEAYNLDRELTVTALALGSIGILFTIPVWLGLFSS
ncbi:MAG: AEC family transporter [Synechococcales bacterium]|nr:AEC family transporter [Synechococcales bacterium]